MVKLKGLYEWQLVDADTKEIVKSGKKWNTVNWYGPWWHVSTTASYSLWNADYNILLSDSTVDSELDYRRYPVSSDSNIINTIATGKDLDGSKYDLSLGKKWAEYNFGPPGSPRTISIIGVRIEEVTDTNYFSFIELSVPITQQTNQYFFVRYTLFMGHVFGGSRVPNNSFVESAYNNLIFGSYVSARYLAASSYHQLMLTPFSPATDIDKCHRAPGALALTTGVSGGPVTGSRSCGAYAPTGPVGALAYRYYGTYGVPKMTGVEPGYSRIFVHPWSRRTQIFSDPANPPSSFGGLTLSGTPTNKFPTIARLHITKTGDASDIVDETFTSDYTVDELTVGQDDWAVDDVVRLTTTGTLPDPLASDTDYYIVSKTGSSPSVKIKLSATQGGSAITLTDDGTGTHTIVRWSTGRYRLLLEPWHFPNDYNTDVTTVGAYQVRLGVDVNGNAMPLNATSGGDVSSDGSDMLRATCKIGDYIWSVSRSRNNNVMNICRWPFMSLEGSEALVAFGNDTLEVRGMEPVGTDIYIATTDGVWKYDTTTPSVAPSQLTITNLLNADISDIAYDTVTGYMWTGHGIAVSGMSRIDLGALTAVQYITGAGQKLENMSTNDALVYQGQLEVYNGRVLRGADPTYNYNSGTYRDAWVYDDNTGYWYNFVTGTYAACLIKGTDQVFVKRIAHSRLYTVTPTGKGTGTSNLDYEWDDPDMSSQDCIPRAIQLNSNAVILAIRDASAYSWVSYLYLLTGGRSGKTLDDYSDPPFSPCMFDGTNTRHSRSYGFSSCMKNLINDAGHEMVWSGYGTISNNVGYMMTEYGWNGAVWEKDNANDRPIPKTGTHSLLAGLSAAFNNAVGKDWDEQFVEDDLYTFVYGPTPIKDDLQTYYYVSDFISIFETELTEDKAISIPASAPYAHNVSQQSDPDFHETPQVMGGLNRNVIVKEGSTEYTAAALPAAQSSSWTYDHAADTIIGTGGNIPTGTLIILRAESGTLPWPFYSGYQAVYAINVDSNTIKVAKTYADAIAGTAINIKQYPAATSNASDRRIYIPAPATETYHLSFNGVFIFSSADASKNIEITYINTYLS